MNKEPSKEADVNASWGDFFSGLGKRIAHSFRCLKNPAYVGKVFKASLGTLGMTAATATGVGIAVATKGRVPIVDIALVAGAFATVPGWKGVGQQWKETGDLSQKIWDSSFPPEQPPPQMPRMLPTIMLFGGEAPSLKSTFSDGQKTEKKDIPPGSAPDTPKPGIH